MSSGAPDDEDKVLLKPDCSRLFLEELEELGDESCQRILISILEDEWERLVILSCNRAGRVRPAKEDALLAADSIKYTLTSNRDSFHLLDFNWRELKRIARRLTLRYWFLRFWYLTLSGIFLSLVWLLWFVFKLGVSVGNSGIEL